MNSVTTQSHDEARPEMDALLHDYFQEALPKPWPKFKAPKPARGKRAETLWSRYSGRLALAACIALLVAGYLALSGQTPPLSSSSGVEQILPNTASKDGGPNRHKSRNAAPRTEEPQDRLEPMGNETAPRRPK